MPNESTSSRDEANAISALVSLWKDIRSDGTVDKRELLALRNWLKNHESLDCPALNDIRCLFREIVSDRYVSTEEIEQLNQAIAGLGEEQSNVVEELPDLDESNDLFQQDFSSASKNRLHRETKDAEASTAERTLVAFSAAIICLAIGAGISSVVNPAYMWTFGCAIVSTLLLFGARIQYVRVCDKPTWYKAPVTRREKTRKNIPDGPTVVHTRFWFNVDGREYVGTAAEDWDGQTAYYDPRFPSRNSHTQSGLPEFALIALFLLGAGFFAIVSVQAALFN